MDLKSGLVSAGNYALGSYALDQYIQQYFTGFMSEKPSGNDVLIISGNIFCVERKVMWKT